MEGENNMYQDWMENVPLDIRCPFCGRRHK